MNGKYRQLLELIPSQGEQAVDWDALEQTVLGGLFVQMARTPQEKEYHGEGDVLAHTKAVCEALVGLAEYGQLPEIQRQTVFLAALLHDIGKIRCTKTEQGRIVSPHHSAVGALMARELLWRELGMSGTEQAQQLRESVCALIRNHSKPTHVVDDADCEYKLLKLACLGETAKYFSIRLLCLLERADVLGRISASQTDYLEKIELCLLLATELGCADAPYPFATPHSKRAFMKQKTKWKDQELFDDTWGEVFLMSGLPGTGKDTWIAQNLPHLPVISLDVIRKELGISPTENQGKVIVAGRERARVLLRQQKPFVWNATDVTAQIRQNQIALFEQYGASVTTVFLETAWEEGLRRNAERKAEVPEGVIGHLLSKLEIPESHECTKVLYQIV